MREKQMKTIYRWAAAVGGAVLSGGSAAGTNK